MFSSSQINEQPQFGSRLFTHTGFNGLLYRISIQCQTVYETHTVTPPSFLETNNRRLRNDSSCYTTPKATFTLVVKSSQHYKGQIISPMVKLNFPSYPSITITTDASKIGFGGHMNSQLYQGIWTKKEAQQHINMLELETVCRTIAYFLPALQNQNVLLRCDNTTVLQYINKHGGTKSVSLCYKVWELFKMTIGHGIQIKAAHLSGHHNMLADRLSRPIIRPTEWTLNNRVLNKFFSLWGKPIIDIFASEDNNKMQVFCTWFPSQKAYAVDALSIPWNNMEAYAFP